VIAKGSKTRLPAKQVAANLAVELKGLAHFLSSKA
jgi:hypothetical protein